VQDRPRAAAPALRLAFVPGVTPDKWLRIWAQRYPRHPVEAALLDEADQVAVLAEGRADLALVRLPVDRTGLHLIPLYHERAVVVFPKEHLLGAFEEVSVGDLADEQLLSDLADLSAMTTRDAVARVASGGGLLVLPMSVARLHHRKDVGSCVLGDGPQTQVGLAWRTDLDTHTGSLVDDFIGVVRGRTERSSRGQRRPI
jgi:hypothetical protein